MVLYKAVDGTLLGTVHFPELHKETIKEPRKRVLELHHLQRRSHYISSTLDSHLKIIFCATSEEPNGGVAL